MSNLEWFKNAGFGIMVHFGLYSLLDGEYKGESVSEWARRDKQIKAEEYHKLASAFNPIYFDAEEWIKIVKESGAKYFVITTKHHEGFALFDSKVSDFNVVKATPFGRDIIKEIADACKKYDIKLGLYYSHDVDWDEPYGGGFICENTVDHKPRNNHWDFDCNPTIDDFQTYLDKKSKPQIKELLTNYGDILQIWFDCPWTVTPDQSKQFYDLVKSIQPDCLCSGRIGNDMGDLGCGMDNSYEMDPDKRKPTEAPVTLAGKDCWSFSVYNNMQYKSAKELLGYKAGLNAKGINMLLNVGPDHLGRFPGPAVEILREMGKAAK